MKFADAVPPAFLLRTILVRGGAFKAKHEFADEGIKTRFFFIANRTPVIVAAVQAERTLSAAEKRLVIGE